MKTTRYYIVFIGLIVFSPLLNAASFDCDKATRAIEQTICDNSELDEADSNLGEIYLQLKQSLNTAQAQKLLKEQQDWLKQRNATCSPKQTDQVDCLIKLYEARILVLSSRLSTSTDKPKKVANDTLGKIQGRWQSTEDSNYVVNIKNNQWTDIYSGDASDSLTIVVLTDCQEAGGQPDKKGNYLQVGGEDGECYSLDSVTEDELTLTFLPRGNILNFKRVK